MKIVAFAIALLLVIALAYRSELRRRTRERQYREAFQSAFSGLPVKPLLEIRYSYGCPSFTVTFSKELELKLSKSNGLTNSFAQSIGGLCEEFGSPREPFDATRAIWFTYDGEIDEMVARSQAN